MAEDNDPHLFKCDLSSVIWRVAEKTKTKVLRGSEKNISTTNEVWNPELS